VQRRADGAAQPPGQCRVGQPGVYRPRAAYGGAAPAEDEIGGTGPDRVDHVGQLGGVEGAVGVEETHDLGGGGEQPGVGGGAEAAQRHGDHGGAVGGGDLRGAVGGAVVRDDRPVPGGDPGQHPRQRGRLVQAG